MSLLRKLGIGATILGSLYFSKDARAQSTPGRYFMDRYNNGEPPEWIPPDYVSDAFAGTATINGFSLDPGDEIATFIDGRLAGFYVWVDSDEQDNRYGYFFTHGGNENSPPLNYENDIGKRIEFRIFDWKGDNQGSRRQRSKGSLKGVDIFEITDNQSENEVSDIDLTNFGIEYRRIIQTDDDGNVIERRFQGEDRAYRTNLQFQRGP